MDYRMKEAAEQVPLTVGMGSVVAMLASASCFVFGIAAIFQHASSPIILGLFAFGALFLGMAAFYRWASRIARRNAVSTRRVKPINLK